MFIIRKTAIMITEASLMEEMHPAVRTPAELDYGR